MSPDNIRRSGRGTAHLGFSGRRYRFRPSAESLEGRRVLSNIVWANVGQASDNFATAFGSQAGLARSVVQAAIAEWESAIVNFNQPGGNDVLTLNISMNTSTASTGGSTSVTSTYSDGKPETASISLGRYGAVSTTGVGTPWYLDANPFSPAFMGGSIPNPFASYAGAGSAGVGEYDLLEVAAREIGHAVGFDAGAQIDQYAKDTGQKDTTSYGTNPNGTPNYAGDYYIYAGPNGFSAALTSFSPGGAGLNAGGVVGVAAAGAAATYQDYILDGSDDLMNPDYTSGQLRVVSTEDADVLAGAYGYTVADPIKSLGTFYSVLDPATEILTVSDAQNPGDFDNNVTISTSGGYITASVLLNPLANNAQTFTQTLPVSDVRSIVVNPNPDHQDWVDVESTPADVTTTVRIDGENLTLGVNGNVEGIQGPVNFLSGPATPTNLGTIDVDDSANGSNYANITIGDVPRDSNLGEITGLAPATITFAYAGVDRLAVKTGTGANTVNLEDNRGPALYLDGNSMSTAVNIGQGGSVAGITQSTTISNSVPGTVLSIDDGSNTANHTFTLGDQFPGQNDDQEYTYEVVNGLAPSQILYGTMSLRSLAITTGPGSSIGTTTVTVNNFGAPTTLSLNSINSNLTLRTVKYPAMIDLGGTQDVANIGQVNAQLNVNDVSQLGSSITATFGGGTSYEIPSSLTVAGNGLTTLTINDGGVNPNAPGLPTVIDPLTTVTITSAAITRVGNAPWVPSEKLNYSNLDYLDLDPGQAYPTDVKVSATSASYTIVNAGVATSLVDLGSGLTGNLGGLLAVHGPSNKTTSVVVDDTQDTTARQVTIQPARGFGPNAVVGLNPGGIYLDNNLKSLTLDLGPKAVVTDEDSPGFPITIAPDAGMLFPGDAGDLVPEAVDAILAEGSSTVVEDPPKVKLILNGGGLQETAPLIGAGIGVE